jgi:NTP pyrophosphatase (non-canonical NTP hydrolase)
MQLKEAIELIWKNRKYDTSSETEAVSHLNEEVAESLKALLKGDRERAQNELEDAMSCLFIAMKVLNIDPEEVVFRQINRMKNQPVRTMHIYSNRVEIKVGEEVRGGWAIWSADELKEAQKMAREFKCKIIWEEENQFKNVENAENLTNVQPG